MWSLGCVLYELMTLKHAVYILLLYLYSLFFRLVILLHHTFIARHYKNYL